MADTSLPRQFALPDLVLDPFAMACRCEPTNTTVRLKRWRSRGQSTALSSDLLFARSSAVSARSNDCLRTSDCGIHAARTASCSMNVAFDSPVTEEYRDRKDWDRTSAMLPSSSATIRVQPQCQAFEAAFEHTQCARHTPRSLHQLRLWSLNPRPVEKLDLPFVKFAGRRVKYSGTPHRRVLR